MRSSAEARAHPRERIRRLVTLSLLTAASLVLFLFEALIPAPLPWVRLGLANVMTVSVLYLYGARDALLLTLVRVVLGSLLVGAFFAPAFFLSLGGGVLAVAAMAAARALGSRRLSIVGVSVAGAVAHNAGQLAVLSLFFLRGADAVRLLPYLTLSATLLGALIGFVAGALVDALTARGAASSSIDANNTETS